MKDVADRAQQHTQRSWKRPYGAGLLIAGCDKTGAHLYYNCPSGAYYDYKAMAIGARSQVPHALKSILSAKASQKFSQGYSAGWN